jgi:hypothetical protein
MNHTHFVGAPKSPAHAYGYNERVMPERSASLKWSAYEHEHIVRESNWFWALGVVAVCAALTSILFHDFLFAILILLGAAIFGLLANIPPELVEFEVSDKGVRVGDDMHRYEEIISFWVESEELPLRLLVDTTKPMAPNLVIPIEDVGPEALRTLLRGHATEVRMKEPLAHKLLEFFGL